jgi:7,8-dihydropterin-6-yl-methyl-4-(beta-D-ribofuranosyl)aminobenzene 5'-phosphate synthase
MTLFPVLLLLWIVWACSGTEEQSAPQTEIEAELAYLEKARGENPDLSILLSESNLREATGTGDVREVLRRYLQGREESAKEWEKEQASIQEMVNLGETAFLEILPLVEFYSSREDLKTEPAVSYLIKTEANTILFDLGRNSENTDPSFLLHNMEKLGVSLEDVDTIVISHNHGDHTGGGVWSRQKTFSVTATQIPLGDKKVYTPIPMTYPGLEPICSAKPTHVAQGIATTGAIANHLFFYGRTAEQALAVNVSGKGIVLIVGCGHQTLPRILDRAEVLFDQPIYGVVGGLHYAVPGSRGNWKGIEGPHRYFGTGRVPWRPFSLEDLRHNIDALKARNPHLVGLSPHDSYDGAIAEFREAFGDAYRSVEAGKKISIS